ncbi:MAG TPA: colanic acid biosynthesis acetyltransferase WcaF [Flavobacteriales bacterium]|nr:colanic acid biosynthesis acetyltransferase WcaF [Flavobacteriales bacterium]
MPRHAITRLDLFENSGYNPGNVLARGLWVLVSGLFFQTWFPWPSFLKASLLRWFGGCVGRGVVIKPRLTIKYPWNLKVGDHVWIGENAWIDNLDRVVIGSNVCISQGAILICGNHDFTKAEFDLITGAITLEDGVWIGAKSTVAPGVTCHSHAVLTIGSMATSDLNPYTIYKGCPAQAVKARTITQ